MFSPHNNNNNNNDNDPHPNLSASHTGEGPSFLTSTPSATQVRKSPLVYCTITVSLELHNLNTDKLTKLLSNLTFQHNYIITYSAKDGHN